MVPNKMGKMMKKILALMIVLVLVVIGTPYLLGIQAKRIYERSVAVMAQESGIPCKSISYEKGIFSSNAVTVCTVGTTTVKIHYKIHHGPILYDASKTKPNGLHFGLAWIETSFAVEPEDSEYARMLAKVREALGGQDPLSVKSLITFTGAMKTFLYSPSIEHTTEGGVVISWQGMEGQVSSDRRYQDFQGFFKAPGLMLKAPNWSAAFKGLDEHFHSKRTEYNLWVGDVFYSMQEAEVNFFPESAHYVMNTLNWDSKAQLENQLYQVNIDGGFKQLATPSGQYGPFVVLVKLINLDPESVSLLQDWMQKSSPAFPQGRMKALDAIFQKLLLKTPTLLVENTKMTFPEGDVSIDLKLSMGGPNAPVASTPTPASSSVTPDTVETSAYINTLEGNFRALIAPAVLQKFLTMGMEKEVYTKPEVVALTPDEKKAALDKEVALKIEKLKSNGLLSEQGTNFELKFTIEKGKVMANGKEIDAASL